MNSPGFEQQIGIETYSTNNPGLGGKLRTNPEDFQVKEIFLYPLKQDNGRFTIAEVSCRNWETHTLVQELADRLHISRKRIDFAGTKDRRALTTQLMSFFQVLPEKLAAIHIKDVEIRNAYMSDTPVRLGDLIGNKFKISIRDIQATVTELQVRSLLSSLDQIGGFPNFYGVQRFGILRPITHLVGRAIIQGDFEHAVMMYVAHPLPGEPEEHYALRKELEKTHDVEQALQTYPASLNFERTMLSVLARSPGDYVGALTALPKNLLMMFVNAYQSFLFNKIISERLRNGIPLNAAVLGDLVVPIRNRLVDTTYRIPVTASNIEKVNIQIKKKKAVVTGLLLGSNSHFAEGAMGQIEHRIFETEHIDPREFIIPEIPFLSSSGSRRPLLALLDQILWTLGPDELHKGKQALRLEFQLQKGCYATCILRELMKSSDPRDY